jgi:hypothetical protein
MSGSVASATRLARRISHVIVTIHTKNETQSTYRARIPFQASGPLCTNTTRLPDRTPNAAQMLR